MYLVLAADGTSGASDLLSVNNEITTDLESTGSLQEASNSNEKVLLSEVSNKQSQLGNDKLTA